MDAEKLERAKAGLKACSVGIACGPGCPYEYLLDIQGQAGCIATMARDELEVLEVLKAQEPMVVTLEEAKNTEFLNSVLKLRDEGCLIPCPVDSPDAMPAHIVPRELLMHTWGHGWEERHYRGDDEDPEGFDLIECVWINGHILTEDGCSAEAGSDYWKEHYGKRYGVRMWAGNVEPTDKQREETPWT